MKPYIFSFLMIFLAMQTALAQEDGQPSGCSITDGCLTYQINGATRYDSDTYIVNYTLTVNCDTRLEYVAFELPAGAEADQPSSFFAAQPDFTVQDGQRGNKNGLNTDFNAIQFTAKQQTDISNGASYTFEYPISIEDYNALGSALRVQAKVAGSEPSLVTFTNFTDCAPINQMPACRIEIDNAVFGLTGVTDNGDGTTQVSFAIQNNLPDNAEVITIEVPGAPEGVTVNGANNGGVYTSNYQYKTTYEGGVITFDAQNNNGYANGAIDYFVFNIPTASYNPEANFMLSLDTGTGFAATSFNPTTCSEDGDITPLPVELLSFKGKATPSGVNLEWETASEINNDRFEVERSQDGRNFQKIGTVDGAGSSSVSHNYSYLDYVAITGILYYRLRQVDFDGTDSYSKTIAIKLKAGPGSGKFAVYPNPANGTKVTVSVAGTGADTNGGIIQVTDMSGRVVFNYKLTAGNPLVEVPVQDMNLAKGMYVVNLLQTSGDKQTQKLVIH